MQYDGRFWVCRQIDGNYIIQTRYPERDGLTFDVYDFSDTHLAVCLPPRAASALLVKHPDVFRNHQEADDATVLLFHEGKLENLAGALKVRRRRKLSDQQKRMQVRTLYGFQFRPQVREGSDA